MLTFNLIKPQSGPMPFSALHSFIRISSAIVSVVTFVVLFHLLDFGILPAVVLLSALLSLVAFFVVLHLQTLFVYVACFALAEHFSRFYKTLGINHSLSSISLSIPELQEELHFAIILLSLLFGAFFCLYLKPAMVYSGIELMITFLASFVILERVQVFAISMVLFFRSR